MDPIYKLTSGQYIDLDKLISISKIDQRGGRHDNFMLYFQLTEKPIIVWIFDIPSIDRPPFSMDHHPEEFENYRKKVVIDWNLYLKQRA